MTDYDVENIVEINEAGINATIYYSSMAIYKDRWQEKWTICFSFLTCVF